MKNNLKIFNTKPKILAKIEKENERTFHIKMTVKDELSHIAIMEMREFLKETNRFKGTSHIVKVYDTNDKKVDQTTLYII